MFPLVRQVQIATDSANGGAARLAGAEVPVYESNESSFAELVARIRKTASRTSQRDSTAACTMGHAAEPGAITSKCPAPSITIISTLSPLFRARTSYSFPSAGGTSRSNAPVIRIYGTPSGSNSEGDPSWFRCGTSLGSPPRSLGIGGIGIPPHTSFWCAAERLCRFAGLWFSDDPPQSPRREMCRATLLLHCRGRFPVLS